MRAAPGLVVVVLALAAPSAAWAQADAGPQPGDVDETFPIVEQSDAHTADAGPAPVKAPKPAAVTVTPQQQQPSTSAPAAPDPAQPAADVDAAKAGPDADAAKVAPATARPSTDDKKPTSDPDGERAPPPPPPPIEKPPEKLPDGFGFGGVPALNYDADNGFGFGVIGTLFYYDGKTRPYRLSLTLQIFMTTKLVQDHNIAVDWLDVGDSPLRLYARVGYHQSLTQNYCGLGGAVTCDPGLARNEATAAGLTGAAADDFTRQFYERRFINPYGVFQARWALVEKPARFELTAGYRAFSFIPGSWDDKNHDGKPDLFPYPGSLYAKDFGDGEPGFDSVISAGFMLDTRDNEPAPIEGIWLEASGRAASKLIGSTWDWAGANLTMRGYAPLDSGKKIVWANRFVVDGIIGDPPIEELARVGGSNDYYVYGGSEAGRGIRVQRYLGKLRVFDQNEVRWRFLDVDFLEQKFGFTAAGFADVGVVGREIAEPGPIDVLPGFGGALRLSWNEDFVIRFDIGVSPLENYAIQPYITIGNPF